MPESISAQVWAVIGQWLVYGASLTGAFTAIIQFIKWMRSKTSVAKLESIVADHEKKLDNDYKSIKDLEHRIVTSENDSEENHKTLRLLLASNDAILQSLIHGTDTDGLKEVSEDIQKYLRNKA